MKEKRPKERERYVLRIQDGTLVEVSREIYLEWYQSRRKEKYQRERSQKYGICSLDALEERGYFAGSLIQGGEGVEDIVLRNICINKLWDALRYLDIEDARLIELLYFFDVNVTEASEIMGCCRRTIQNRRKRILQELRQKIQ